MEVDILTKKTKKVRYILAKLDELPTLPHVIYKINSLASDPTVDTSKIIRVISMDQSLTLKILKLVNSSFYGFSRQIKTVNHAVVILGFNEIKNLATATSVFSTILDQASSECNKEMLWGHSVACAATTRMIATKLNLKDNGEYFTSGLLHDIGRLFLFVYMPQEMEKVTQKISSRDMSIIDVENEVLGISHTLVGSILADTWKLPETLTDAIKYHHNPHRAKNNPLLVAVVNLADYLCHKKGYECGEINDSAVSESTWKTLRTVNSDLDKSCINELIVDMDEELQGIEDFMQLLQ